MIDEVAYAKEYRKAAKKERKAFKANYGSNASYGGRKGALSPSGIKVKDALTDEWQSTKEIGATVGLSRNTVSSLMAAVIANGFGEKRLVGNSIYVQYRRKAS